MTATQSAFVAASVVCLVCVVVLLALIHAAPVDNSEDCA
jgi:hypothetical protein